MASVGREKLESLVIRILLIAIGLISLALMSLFFVNNPAARFTESGNFDFSVNVIRDGGSVARGTSISPEVLITARGFNVEPVSLFCANLPENIHCSFSPETCKPDCVSEMTIYVEDGAAEGVYPVTIYAVGTSSLKSDSFTLTVE